jgi:hypothetical protein
MRLFVLTTVVAGLTLLSGTLHGWRTHRWGRPDELLRAGVHVTSLPASFGPWRLIDEKTLETETEQVLQCVGYVVRTYQHDKTGQVVNLALLAGPPGPISVHRPEICYSARNYVQDAEPTVVRPRSRPEGDSDSFWKIVFRPQELTPTKLHVYYGWSDGTQWSADENPRVRYGGRPFLYKIQLASTEPLVCGASTRDSCEDFLYHLLGSGFDWQPTKK